MFQNESGRSLIETLGILSIMGLLSLTGIAMFNSAVDRFKSNNILYGARLAYTALLNTQNHYDWENAGNLPETHIPYQKMVDPKLTPYIKISGIEKGICQKILNLTRNTNITVFTPDWKEFLYCSNVNEFIFAFDGAGKKTQCVQNSDCPNETPYCRNSKCNKCEAGLQLNNGNCSECPTGNDGVSATSAEYCHMCGNNYFMGLYSACYECNSTFHNARSESKEECDRCPQRCWDETTQSCLKSTEGNAFINGEGKCNRNCVNGQLLSWYQSDYSCKVCPTGNDGVSATSAEYCHMCGNNYFMGLYNACYECNSTFPNARSESKEECDRCPNRYFDEITQKCLLCPTGKTAAQDGLSCQ